MHLNGKMAAFLCCYCSFIASFVEVVYHSTVYHGDKRLSLRRKIDDGNRYRSLHFDLIPRQVFSEGKQIVPFPERLTVKCVDVDDELISPPSRNKLKITPSDEQFETVQSSCEKGCQTDDVLIISYDGLQKSQTSELQYFGTLLPRAIDTLQEYGHLPEWKMLFTLLVNKTLPRDNIAYKLFLNVVLWFSKRNTSGMRYDIVLKRFWRTGMRLFKGKFLRFMSGLKHKGQVISGAMKLGDYDSSSSQINFAVPSRDFLRSCSSLKESCSKPGIIIPLIKKMGETATSKTSDKLSVDLKKLNPGGQHGDVNCFGFETSPTFSERTQRLQNELHVIECCRAELHNSPETEIDTKTVPSLIPSLQATVRSLSGRLMDLRNLHTKRQYGLEKLKVQSGPNWKESKLAFVISAVRTTLRETKECISTILSTIDDILHIGATLNTLCRPHTTTIELQQQANYKCLPGIDGDMIKRCNRPLTLYCRYVKQRTQLWYDIRSKARVTGSTAYSALGFDGLKSQKTHFDFVLKGKEKPDVDADSKLRMEHGQINEINAVATLVSAIMPTFFPDLHFQEEGCYILQNKGRTFCVVSPDGSLRKGGKVEYAVEIKCPFPGSHFGCSVMYKVPNRYVLQLLLEMKALSVDKLLFVCWLPESTSMIEVSFSNDLWQKTWTLMNELYGEENPASPKTLNALTKDMKSDISAFIQTNCKFFCEVSSVKGIHCSHEEVADLYTTHFKKPFETEVMKSFKVDEALHKSRTAITSAHGLSRDIAKQVMVVMLSDLDREYKPEIPHSLPIAYALTGYSITTKQTQDIMEAVRMECRKAGLNVIAESFDGAFVRMATRGIDNEPLTMLQLSKDIWSASTKTAKVDQVKEMFAMGHATGMTSFDDVCKFFEVDAEIVSKNGINCFKSSIVIGLPKDLKHIFKTPKNWKMLLSKSSQKKARTTKQFVGIDDIADATLMGTDTESCDSSLDILISTCNSVDNPENQEIESSSDVLDSTTSVFYDDPTLSPKHSTMLDEDDLEQMWVRFHSWSLAQTKSKSKKICSKAEFLQQLSSAASIGKLTKQALLAAIEPIQHKLAALGLCINNSTLKPVVVNTISSLVGDGTIMSGRITKSSPRSLRSILKRYLQQKMPKDVLNSSYASQKYPEHLRRWNDNAAFKADCKVSGTNSPPFWYSQPKYLTNEASYMFSFLDPEHLLTNTRTKVCSTGIPERGISRNAWRDVAKNGKSNGSGLSLALVDDLIDKQNVSFALKTFSHEVELATLTLGYGKEAQFCQLIRNWYRAQDERGIAAFVRHQYEQNIRSWLLDGVDFSLFPPYSTHVEGLPIVLFEGLLIHIDRRLQLYPFTQNGTYNPRSLGTLDNENLFGAFQDWDAKGTGVLRADEVSNAMLTACELFETRLNEDRGFFMHTSASRVYPCPPLMPTQSVTNTIEMDDEPTFPSNDRKQISAIEVKDHTFDLPERRKTSLKRKTWDNF